MREIKALFCGLSKRVSRFLIFLIRVYQRVFRYFPRRCRYYPSCSDYMIEAIAKKGSIKGLLLGIFRIIRCNPFSPGGYDPVK
ncbi:MAG: membrane protein insertion efficiency factor YidD [Candidatus Aureabacteria bacterium]|nr:membrane protein insertion efficiency factor YidD [Candidatus Auribacterota bacterium]